MKRSPAVARAPLTPTEADGGRGGGDLRARKTRFIGDGRGPYALPNVTPCQRRHPSAIVLPFRRHPAGG